tara:strand:+ start:294 stop:479 length:186 start_codon:yes stop_codon:yes gene_type:complete
MSLITVTLSLDENEVSMLEARSKDLRKTRGLIIEECLELYIYEEILVELSEAFHPKTKEVV